MAPLVPRTEASLLLVASCWRHLPCRPLADERDSLAQWRVPVTGG
jgi:hypothetical protein